MPVKSTKRPAKLGQPWSQRDLDYLSEKYGLLSNEVIAQQLKRRVTSIPLTARKKLRLKLTDNFYTASELAKVLGIGSGYPIIAWAHKGWLKGSRRNSGAKWLWCFVEEDIVECLRQRPWLADLKSMENHYFRAIVKEEWKKDSWYTVEQAAPLLGVSKSPVLQYIYMRWLPAERCLGSRGGVWIIRKSAIEAFLKDDPRQRHEYACRYKSRKLRRKALLWNFECPGCGREVEILAPPDMVGPEVREKFISIYVNGTCFHGAEVKLTIPP